VLHLIFEPAKIFVTGADGFIGSHLTEALVREGYDVKVMAFYNSFNSLGWLDHCASDVKGHFEVCSGDVRDAHFVHQVMSGRDVLLHLAALIAIPYSYQSPSSYIDTNVTGTLNVLQAARHHGYSRVIHTSTSEVYGSAQFVPISEKHPIQGQSPYSASKIAADQLAYSFFASYELPLLIVRPFNTYGPRQSNRAVIPTIITQLTRAKSNIELGSCTPTRDFNFIEDTVTGFLAAVNAEGVFGEVINLGSNYEISIGELVELIGELMNTRIDLITDPKRIRPKASEVDRLWADNSKAKALLKWQPKYAGRSGLKSGLAKTIEWFLKPENIVKYKTDTYSI
jgi:NAD dependent epimerase/dehydratase